MKYRVEEIRLGFGVEFILENERKEDKVSTDFKASYMACYSDDEIVGIISYNDTSNNRRIKVLMAKEGYRNNEVYDTLVKAACDTKKNITVFAPENVREYFERNGFKTQKINRYNIHFMRFEREKKNEKSGIQHTKRANRKNSK